MIQTTENFFNKLADEIRQTYFADVKYYRDSEKCTTASYTIELFNNGCLNYRKLIGRLAKACNDSTAKIHAIVQKYIVSFGAYRYTPKQPQPPPLHQSPFHHFKKTLRQWHTIF